MQLTDVSGLWQSDCELPMGSQPRPAPQLHNPLLAPEIRSILTILGCGNEAISTSLPLPVAPSPSEAQGNSRLVPTMTLVRWHSGVDTTFQRSLCCQRAGSCNFRHLQLATLKLGLGMGMAVHGLHPVQAEDR